jgi:2'-5' RNA ligase
MRLFIAVEIPEEIKIELQKLLEKLKTTDADVKWVRPEGMHITLKFLGEADEKSKDKIIAVLEEVSKKKNSFTVNFRGLGVFPGLKRPRVVWVGIEKGREELRDMAKELESALSELGFPKEAREFSAHLTLGRVKSGRNREKLVEDLKNYNDFVLPPFNADKINLMQSVLKREGAEYSTVVSYKL